MVFDILRESTIGVLLNRVSGGRILPYPDQRTDFVIPERYLATSSPASTSSSAAVTRSPSSATLYIPEKLSVPPVAHSKDETTGRTGIPVEKIDTFQSEATLEAGPEVVVEKSVPDTKGYQLVEWYDSDDPENPRNWSFRKRAFVMFQICLLTYVHLGCEDCMA